MSWVQAARVIAAFAVMAPLALPWAASAQEEHRLRPDERQRPAPADRPAGRDEGPARDPSIDDPRAVEQQDLVTRCRAPGAPATGQGGATLPNQATSAERDERGNCILPPTGQPLGPKAGDKLIQRP